MKAKIPKLTAEQKAQILGDPRPQPDPAARAGASNPLAGLHTLCADSPRGLISLWDMNQIIAKDFLSAWQMLERELTKAQNGNQQQLVTEAERCALVAALIDVHYQCGRLGLAQSNRLANEFLEQLQNPAWHRDRTVRQAVLQGLPIPPMPKELPLPSFAMIYSQLRGIMEQAREEMDAIRMAVVFKDQAQYFERDDLFGPKFHNAASEAINLEIKRRIRLPPFPMARGEQPRRAGDNGQLAGKDAAPCRSVPGFEFRMSTGSGWLFSARLD